MVIKFGGLAPNNVLNNTSIGGFKFGSTCPHVCSRNFGGGYTVFY